MAAKAVAAVETALPWVDGAAGALILGTAAAALRRDGSRAGDYCCRAGVDADGSLAAMLVAISEHLGRSQVVEFLLPPARAKVLHITYVELR